VNDLARDGSWWLGERPDLRRVADADQADVALEDPEKDPQLVDVADAKRDEARPDALTGRDGALGDDPGQRRAELRDSGIGAAPAAERIDALASCRHERLLLLQRRLRLLALASGRQLLRKELSLSLGIERGRLLLGARDLEIGVGLGQAAALDLRQEIPLFDEVTLHVKDLRHDPRRTRTDSRNVRRIEVHGAHGLDPRHQRAGRSRDRLEPARLEKRSAHDDGIAFTPGHVADRRRLSIGPAARRDHEARRPTREREQHRTGDELRALASQEAAGCRPDRRHVRDVLGLCVRAHR